MDLAVKDSATEYEQEDRAAYFEAVHRGFERAERAVRGTIDLFYAIGADTVCLRFAGEALVKRLTPAFAHLQTEPTSAPALTVCLWDSVSTGTPLPLLVSSLLDLLCMSPWTTMDVRRDVKGYNDEFIRTNFHFGPNILSVLDSRQNRALYWVNDAASLPYYELGSPLKEILSQWAGTRGYQYVHAGAVGAPRGGALLAGKGGVGKSTTALACLDSGLLYVGDDYSLVGFSPAAGDAHKGLGYAAGVEPTTPALPPLPGTAPYVYSLYNTAKLGGPDDMRRFPHLVPWLNNPCAAQNEKLMMFLHQHCPGKLSRSFPIRTVLLPRVSGRPETAVRPATAGAALAALAPSTLFQLPGAARQSMQFLAALVRRVPCYVLDVGTEMAGIPPVIADLLDTLAS